MKPHYLLTPIILLSFLLVFTLNSRVATLPELAEEQVLQEAIIDLQQTNYEDKRDVDSLHQSLDFYEKQIETLVDQNQPQVLIKEYKAPNIEAPVDRIEEHDIKIDSQSIEIRVADVRSWYVVDTNSMLPTLDVGTTLITKKPESFSDIHIGDIIVFEAPETTIVHRVINISNNQFITKGDNNQFSDSYVVTLDTVYGVVIGLIY